MFQPLNNRCGHYALLALAWAGLCLPNLGGPSLWDVDEGHNAEASREMLVAGDIVVPTFNFRWRHDKPALLYWCQMTAYEAFGVNEWSARLPSAFAALATILICYEFARRMFSPATGLLAGLILVSSVMFCAAAHFANPDALLLTFTSLSLLFFWSSYANGTRSWFIWAGVSGGLAMLAKGPVGVVLPGTVVIVFLLWSRRLRLLWDWRLPVGIMIGALVAVPWYAAVIAETKGEFFREFFLKHNAGRFTAPMEGHGGPAIYYLVCLLVGFAPWSVFLGPTVFYAIGKRRDTDDERVSTDAYRFLWCWMLVYLLFFSASATKLPNYVLPACVPLAILTGTYLDRWRRQAVMPPVWVPRLSLVCLALVGTGVAVGPMLVSGKIDAPFLRGRSLPGLEVWAIVGIVPVVGALIGWWCLQRDDRRGYVAAMASTAGLFVAVLAAGAAAAVDAHKAARPLMAVLPPGLNEREIRIGCYEYYQPSLVFYSRREVTRLATETEAVAFLNYPMEVYLLMPATLWNAVAPRLSGNERVLARHDDLYLGREVVLVTNR